MINPEGRCSRFSTGEGKAVVNETVRGHDIFMLAGTDGSFGKNQHLISRTLNKDNADRR